MTEEIEDKNGETHKEALTRSLEIEPALAVSQARCRRSAVQADLIEDVIEVTSV
jgi:hypothetical protein